MKPRTNSLNQPSETDFTHKGLLFEQTCCVEPLQYDVYKNGKKVAFVHLRSGILTCYMSDKEIYKDTSRRENQNPESFHFDSFVNGDIEKISNLINTNLGNTSSQRNKQTTNNKIFLYEVMSIVDKLGEDNRQDFLHNLATQKNLSKNVLNLLINKADSTILTRLCSNASIYGEVLDELINKLARINNGIDKIILIQNIPLYIDFYDDCMSGIDDDEQEEKGPVFVEDIKSFVNFLLTNQNLSTLQIENITKQFRDYINIEILCKHPNTPSWVLQKSYERYTNTKLGNLILFHRNLYQDFKEKIQIDIKKEQDKKMEDNEINDILNRHPDLDIYQILQYYENDNDTITSQKIAEAIYAKDLGRFRYGAKTQYEKLQFKLELSNRYNLGEGSKLRIIYDMIGDNIVDRGSLEIYESFGIKPNDGPIYLNIAQTEDKYAVKIDQDQIKIIINEILNQMPRWTSPRIEEVENVYKIAQDLDIEINDVVKKYYINAIIDTTKNIKLQGQMDIFETLYYFSKSLQLILANINLFSQEELEQYVIDINQKISFPISDIDYMLNKIQTKYSRTTTLFQNSKTIGFKDIKDLERSDQFNLIDKLGLSEKFKHSMVIKELKEYMYYNHENGIALMQRFGINRSELIYLIVSRGEEKEEDSGFFTKEDKGRCFGMEGQYSLQECLTKYGIALEEVLPSLLLKIKDDLASNIQKKDYVRAQAIIKNYPISDIPEFQELIKTVQTLTKVH